MSSRNQIFNKNNSDFSIEEIVSILLEKNLHNHKKYLNFCLENEGKIDGRQLPRKPWLLNQDNISCIQFFNKIFPTRNKSIYIKKTRLSIEDHFEIIRSNKIYTIKDYQKFYNENKDNLNGVYANPWIKFNMPAWDFLDLAIPDRAKIKKSEKEYKVSDDELIKIMQDNNLCSSRMHRKFYLENKDNISIPSRPWDRFNMRESDFFDKYFPHRIKTSSIDEIKDIFLSNNITSTKHFKDYMKNNPDHKINLNFHRINKIKFSEFLDLVWGKDRVKHKEIIPLEDFLCLLRENKIFSFSQYKGFYKLNKKEITRIPGNPMVSYNLSQPEIFKLAFPMCDKFPNGRLHQKTKRKDVILFLSENNIQTVFQYQEIEKELPLIKNILKSNENNISKILQEIASIKGS